MNITEFAQYAGVSKAAVSRYFNGGYLSADKRARIEAAVEATGYHPSIQAQMLRTRRTRQVGVILNLSQKPMRGGTPHPAGGGHPAQTVQRQLPPHRGGHRQRAGRIRLPAAAHQHRQRSAEGTPRPGHPVPPHGGRHPAHCHRDTPEHKAVLERMHVPLVVLGQQFPGCCSVYHDDFGAAQAAAAHMLAKGRHAPGYIGVTLLDKAAGQQRRAGFEAAVKDAGLPVRPQRMAVAKFSTASGYEQAARLLGSDPRIDCLFCATDAIALGAMQYCREAGIRIPEDVMIAAVGDSSVGRNTFVPLTSAHLHYKTSGRDAAALLMDLLNDPHTVPRSQMLGYELVCRESTGD